MFLRTLNRNIVNLEHVHSIEKHSYKKQQHGKLVQLYSISVNYPMFQSEGEAFRDDSVQIVSDLTESQANFYLDEIAKGVGTCLGLNAMDIVKLEKYQRQCLLQSSFLHFSPKINVHVTI